jgi:hypothetical protein
MRAAKPTQRTALFDRNMAFEQKQIVLQGKQSELEDINQHMYD